MVQIKPEFYTERQGKKFVLYAGLLDAAHQDGLKRISTTLIQIPHENNGNVAVVSAEVETSRGTFSGIGDASQANVNRMILPHIIRMAETRAKARALRDAINVEVTSVEELGGNDEDEPSSTPPPNESTPITTTTGDSGAPSLTTIKALLVRLATIRYQKESNITPTQQQINEWATAAKKEMLHALGITGDAAAMGFEERRRCAAWLQERIDGRLGAA